MLLVLFLLLFLSIPPLLLSDPAPNLATDPFLSGALNHSYNIDCGGTANFTSTFGRPWLSDRFYSGGSPGMVAEPHRFAQPQERTLRFFPPSSSGKKSCYSVPVLPGRYYIRTFTVYDNYDSKLRSPSYDVSIEGTLVFTYRSPWPEQASKSGAYSDLIAPVVDSIADICFYSIATDPPVIASLELAPVHPLAYDAATTGSDMILVNYGRLTCGSNLFGPGFTNDTDQFARVWQSDADFRSSNIKVKALSAGGHQIMGSNQQPNFFPTRLYETAVTTVNPEDILEYQMPVDTRLSYMVWFHFAEIDVGVTSAGQRVFDIVLGGNNVTRIDIFKEVGGFTAFKWFYIMENLTDPILKVQLVPVVGQPILCGLENYAMAPLDMATVPAQVAAMRALKESLKVPARMGWNGDPCAPSTWDAWEGVTCQRNPKGPGLVVTHLELASQGLKGFVSDQIGFLTDLVSLNLSYNSLGHNLPWGLGQATLVTLDLSSNKFTGDIPDSLGSNNLQTALLNNNELEGQVPEKLYSIGVHGGIIDLSGNKGLCGVPTLPACPMFWDKKGLNTTGKIALAASFAFVLFAAALVGFVIYVKRRENDYDFDFPQDFSYFSSAIAAKRNRYHRAKSFMQLEMETQTSNGLHNNGTAL
ncbi:Leucine-rich repeat protein kinase family protein [Rhynchospora pubera]|uniref:Leucine-rich repeat protein kinase family protein n=1 Tax=Rhynchospora pubera TaxID=906938 RepID=A0AAV8HL31_9POAL|nr:Leucine-rich repeat protein kinase family protein [Rhynchospora pubera]